MKNLIKKNPLLLKVVAAIGVFISRLSFLPANFSPLGSFGFFGNNTWLYFSTIIGFDYLVGGFYKGFYFTYLGFAMYPLLGKLAANKWKNQAILLPLASFLFFFFSNLSSFWLWYPHTLQGLISCYLLALPFYQKTLLGDLVFGYGYIAVKLFHKNYSHQKHSSLPINNNSHSINPTAD